MRWFGLSWGAPICQLVHRMRVPIGQPCADCGVALLESDQGYELPGIPSIGYYHKLCFDRMLGIRPEDLSPDEHARVRAAMPRGYLHIGTARAQPLNAHDSAMLEAVSSRPDHIGGTIVTGEWVIVTVGVTLPNIFPTRSQARKHAERLHLKNYRIEQKEPPRTEPPSGPEAAMHIIERFAGTEEMHHLRWVVDQVVRCLVDDYDQWLRERNTGDYTPWDPGIAP